MWISGGPGVGKSAILQTICETLAGSSSPVHASFFFGRGQGARERAASLAPTIAYQFTCASIICRWYIWYLLRNNPAILREAFHSQFQKLVTRSAAARSYIQQPMVVVIDGIDECNDVHDRVSLLKLILEAANTKAIRFLIASRPEEEIETFFNHPDVAQHIDRIVLNEESFKTSKDIAIYLRSEFARIRQSRPHSIPLPIDGEEWPGDAIIYKLAIDSDGQFIFATLSIGYIDTEFFSPHEQLESLLKPPPDVAPFTKLDRLYHQILNRRPAQEQGTAKFFHYQKIVQGILQIIIAWPSQSSITGIATVLGEEVHVVQAIVRGPLRTVFKLDDSNPDSKIGFCHKSLGDFLLDPRRSGEFHVPENALDLLYHRILSLPLPSDPSRTFSRAQLVGVLHVVVTFPRTPRSRSRLPTGMELFEIARLSNIHFNVVRNIVKCGTTSLLFTPPEDYNCNIEFYDDSFRRFLLDRDRAGEFHIPQDALDLAYLRILSWPPPSYPPQTFSRKELIGVLHTLVAWPTCLFDGAPGTAEEHKSTTLHVDTIALVLDVHPAAVRNIVQRGPMALLFAVFDTGNIYRRDDSIHDFLLDPRRSGEFHVPPNARDFLYLDILSRPPAAYFQQHLLEVLHELLIVHQRNGSLAGGNTKGVYVDSGLEEDIERCPQWVLFKRGDGFDFRFIDPSLGSFLLDPGRSGKFCFEGNRIPDPSILWPP